MNKEKKPRPPRFLLQMREDLRHQLEAVAIANGRTLTAEINDRLRASLKQTATPAKPSSPYAQAPLAPTHHIGEPGLTATERALLDSFHALPVEKQLALLTLLRGIE